MSGELSLKKAAYWVGFTLTVFTLSLFISYILRNNVPVDISALNNKVWMLLLGLSLVYYVTNFLLVFGWKSLIVAMEEKITYKNAFIIYGISQLGKYIPGSIIHFVGRQAMGMTEGIKGKVLLKSTLLELLLLSLAGISFIPLCATKFHQLPSGLNIIIFIALLFLISSLIWKYAYHFQWQTFITYCLFLSISGMIFTSILYWVISSHNINGSTFIVTVAGFVVAWLCGLVAIGSPAGIGVREIALLVLLEHLYETPELLMAITLSRLVTTLGDVLFFSSAFLLKSANKIY